MSNNHIFIVAEVGINANGDINIAKQLIDIAKKSGCDAVKFQKRDINSCYSKEELDKPRESPWGTTNREQKEGLEFNQEEYEQINRYCELMGIEWFASPWDLKSFEFLKQFNLIHNKVPSARLGHVELLKAIAKEGKYTFISTGMASLYEIGLAIAVFKNYNCPFELMHCNSQYPMPEEDANLNCIPKLRDMFNCKVGYSDHGPGLITSIGAAVLGATSIEKHITVNRTMYGSDQAASVEPNGFNKLVEYIRAVEIIMGSDIKQITSGEIPIRKKLWREEDYDLEI
jgi:N-acetylneuraminate synthase